MHPLSGVVAALLGAGDRPVLAVACDMPFVTAELLADLAARTAPLVLPEADGRLHPLLGRWHPSLLPARRDALAREAPLHVVAAELDAYRIGAAELRRFGDPERLLFNVNEPGDLERAAALLLVGAATLDLLRQLDRTVERDADARAEPARDRRGGALGRVRGLGGEAQYRADLVRRSAGRVPIRRA